MKKQNIIMGISFVLLFVMVMGVSYAAYKFSANGTKENVITTGTISMSYKQNSFIDLKNTYPKTDIYAIGTKEDNSSMSFNVSMETSGTTTINYALALTEIEEGETLKSDKVKIYLEKEGKVVSTFEENKGQTIESFKNKYVEGLIDNYAIYQDVLTTSKETHNYTLTAWIDESYDLPIKNETTTIKETNKETYKFKVKVVGVDTPITIKEKSSGAGIFTLIALTNNKNESGLYTITHAADSTLQIGATESVTEYRYRGASPKNYVTFNNETWRILGIFLTEDVYGNIGHRIKLIRNESIGELPWMTADYDASMWSLAYLSSYLNDDYFNSLSESAKEMIHNSKYYLNGYGITEIDTSDGNVIPKIENRTISKMYSYERKIQNGTSCSIVDYSGLKLYVGPECYTYDYPTNWVGKIALMYVSDYGYASLNCEDKELYSSSSSNDISSCNSTNWLYDSKIKEWTLDQFSSYYSSSYYVTNDGKILGYGEEDFYNLPSSSGFPSVRPVLYLTSSAKITGGTGTSTDPYTLGL